jgi:hypothetical protein
LRNRLELLLFNGGAEMSRKYSFHHVLADLFCEPAANQRLWNFAGAEARDSRHLSVPLGYRREIAADLVSWDLNLYFARAIRVQCGRGVGMPLVGMPFVRVSFMGLALMFMTADFFSGDGLSAGLRCGLNHFA